MNIFELVKSDFGALINNDGLDIIYRREADDVELNIRALVVETDVVDERVGEGDVMTFLIKDDDLSFLSPPKYKDQVVFQESIGVEEVWEVVGVSYVRPSFWRVECMRRFNPKPNVPNRTQNV